MIRITAYIRPHRLEQVKSAVASLGVTGMSVTDVRGSGNGPEQEHWLAGGRVQPMPISARIEVVVPDDWAEEVTRVFVESARTGEQGDGKVFLERVADALRVRTGERGAAAV